MPDTSDEELDGVDEGNSSPWVPYRDREEWKDVVPIPQDDGPHPIVAIAYSDKCKHATLSQFHTCFRYLSRLDLYDSYDVVGFCFSVFFSHFSQLSLCASRESPDLTSFSDTSILGKKTTSASQFKFHICSCVPVCAQFKV